MTEAEILLYSDITPYSATDFIMSMQNASDNDICVRVNGDGGDVECGWGMIAKFKEHAGNKLLKVDGRANSMYAFFLCYSDDSEILDVATITMHRAAYPDWYENDPDLFTPEKQADVNRTNKFLQTALEAKVDVEKFEALAGMKMKQFFALGQRSEVTLSAADAKRIGLINRVIKITPSKTAEIKKLKYAIAAKYRLPIEADIPSDKNKPQKSNKMNISEFKNKYPKTFAQAMKAGADQEFDRINACLVYVEIDAKGVKEAIKSREPLTATAMAEFSLKALNKKDLKKVEDDSAEDVTTDEDKNEGMDAKEKRLAEIRAAAKKGLGLK